MADPSAAPRLIAFNDQRSGTSFLMSVPPDSPWWPLLAPVTEAAIRVPTEAERADDAHYRACGGAVLTGKRP